jgi:hypothetical protein
LQIFIGRLFTPDLTAAFRFDRRCSGDWAYNSLT